MRERCSSCRSAAGRGTIRCVSERPPAPYCAPCYSKHVKTVHDQGDKELEPEQTEAWRQITARLKREGGPISCWQLIERPPEGQGDPNDEDDWFCIAVSFDREEADAWHEPSEGRVSKHVLIAGVKGQTP